MNYRRIAMTDLKVYSIWDANVRWFHWINLLCMLGLIAVGVVILNDKALGVSTDGKTLLKPYTSGLVMCSRRIYCGVWSRPLSMDHMRAGGHGSVLSACTWRITSYHLNTKT